MDKVRESYATVWQRGEMILLGAPVQFVQGESSLQNSSWSGTLTLALDGFIAHGGPYELRLDDGRHAHILVKNTREEGGKVLAEFVGIGTLPPSE